MGGGLPGLCSPPPPLPVPYLGAPPPDPRIALRARPQTPDGLTPLTSRRGHDRSLDSVAGLADLKTPA
ncbi:hypothetical protein C4B68_24685 [Streptomyces dengpaensis]|uniref:Uncharacterized protein n=1 Tax=Streptomyces dengpaensis TaxID=2049881 RepID=A0ABM6SVU8_9ACTN|nr:hypothetical protein C4B68_24685 [Streptomyces dengpaensis]